MYQLSRAYSSGARVVGTPKAYMASLRRYSRNTGPRAAFPSPPREKACALNLSIEYRAYYLEYRLFHLAIVLGHLQVVVKSSQTDAPRKLGPVEPPHSVRCFGKNFRSQLCFQRPRV